MSEENIPLLNRDEDYVPTAGRTFEDDHDVTFDAAKDLLGKTHITAKRFGEIYRDVMEFFTKTESYSYKKYQSGELSVDEFVRELTSYLKKNYPDELGDNAPSDWDFRAMANRVLIAIFQYDVLQPLIDNPDTSDVKVSGPHDIRVRVKGKAYKSNAEFLSEEDLVRFVEGLGIRNKVDIMNHPTVTFTDKHDENYLLRFTISAPFVCAVDYPYLHIRKVPKDKPDFDELIRRDMLNSKIKSYLIDRAKNAKCVVFAGPPGCVDRQTEFFNGKCWKSLADYKEGDKVLQYDTETGKASLVKPLAYIKKPCDKMYHFETKYGIDQTLSSEHRVLYVNKTHKNGKKVWSDNIHEMSAEEFKEKQNSGHFNGGFLTTFDYAGKGVPLSDAEIKLMLAVICDGSFNKRERQKDYCIVSLKKQRKIDELKAVLKEAGIEYTEHSKTGGYVTFRFKAPRVEKSFGSFWYRCSKHQLEVVCENVLKWDGSVDSEGRKSFCSTSKESADFVQFAFSACGYRACIHEDKRVGQTYKTGGKEYERISNSYTVTISDNTIVGMAWHNDGRKNNPVLTEVTPEDGYKYCFTVPTHALVLRRNGKIFISGNSGKTTALNAFIEYIPKTRETLVIQENDELTTEQSGFMFKHPTHGFGGEQVVTLEDLGKMALVEGCNEFIIGEVKGGEMRSAMTLLNAGGYAALTVHSTNAYEVMNKLADLVKYGSDYSFEEARMMLSSIDTIVYMEGYKVREILESRGYNTEKHCYDYVPIYKYGM